MKSLDCNQIKIFINLEIIGEEEIRTKKLYIYIFFKSKKILQFGVATWHNYDVSAQLLLYSI